MRRHLSSSRASSGPTLLAYEDVRRTHAVARARLLRGDKPLVALESERVPDIELTGPRDKPVLLAAVGMPEDDVVLGHRSELIGAVA